MFRKVACVVVLVVGAVSVPATAVWAIAPEPAVPDAPPRKTPSGVDGPTQAGPAPQAGPPTHPGRQYRNSYIVVLRDSVPDVPAVAAEHGRGVGFQANFVYSHALKGYSASIPDAAIAGIQRDPRVLFVSSDVEIQANEPPRCANVTLCQRFDEGVDRIDAELSSTKSGDGKGSVKVNVAVLDTGTGPHPDLNV